MHHPRRDTPSPLPSSAAYKQPHVLPRSEGRDHTDCEQLQVSVTGVSHTLESGCHSRFQAPVRKEHIKDKSV